MVAWYNETDLFAAGWLEELIDVGAIAFGAVDRRPIQEITTKDLAGFDQHHFFAGIGGWSWALQLANWPDDQPVWTGSCPCQPFSIAGKQKGIVDDRHLWPYWRELIRECRPPVVFGEQVASPLGRGWLDTVSAEMERMDFTIGAADLCAAGVGAPHIRQRLYFGAVRVAYTEDGNGGGRVGRTEAGVGEEEERRRGSSSCGVNGRADVEEWWSRLEWLPCADGKARPIESGLEPLAHGIPARVGRLRGYGNAIVPEVAATFITAFTEAVGVNSEASP